MFEDTVVPGRTFKVSYSLFRQTTELHLTKGNVPAL